jgi:hypothetical protein
MHIDKSYFTLPEILERWQITEPTCLPGRERQAPAVGARVRRADRVRRLRGGRQDGEPFRVPWEQKPFSGLLDLHACDVFQLFRCGEVHLSEFRTPKADYASPGAMRKPVLVMIGDLLLRRDERDRFEIETGFSPGGQPMEEAPSSTRPITSRSAATDTGSSWARSRRKSCARCTRPRRRRALAERQGDPVARRLEEPAHGRRLQVAEGLAASDPLRPAGRLPSESRLTAPSPDPLWDREGDRWGMVGDDGAPPAVRTLSCKGRLIPLRIPRRS